MKNKIQTWLIPFYFGAIEDEKRLIVERELLSDPEILVDYFDLKRKIESAKEIPNGPSQQLWYKLNQGFQPCKKIIYSLSFGLAAVGLLFFAILLFKGNKTEQMPTNQGEILFDLNRELPANSSVL